MPINYDEPFFAEIINGFAVFAKKLHHRSLTEVQDRSSHQRCSVRKGVLRNFTKFTGKHLCQSLFFNKVAG